MQHKLGLKLASFDEAAMLWGHPFILQRDFGIQDHKIGFILAPCYHFSQRKTIYTVNTNSGERSRSI